MRLWLTHHPSLTFSAHISSLLFFLFSPPPPIIFLMSQANSSNQIKNQSPNSPFSNFLADLKSLYPNFRFQPGPRFLFRPPNTIFYEPSNPNNANNSFQDFALQLLHELGHAVSGHRNFQLSIDRIKIETEAWHAAQTILENHHNLQTKYHLFFNQDFAEAHLDTYRRWLHQKTTCKKCGLTMFQDKNQTWYCPHCDLI